MKILIAEKVSMSSSFNIGVSRFDYFMNYFWIDDLIEKDKIFSKIRKY